MAGAVIRIGGTVHRRAGPWTPAVHDLLRHLERLGFRGAPRPLGIDANGREVLTYIPGELAHRRGLGGTELSPVCRLIRQEHLKGGTFPASPPLSSGTKGPEPTNPPDLALPH